jgi:hypothetical protein
MTPPGVELASINGCVSRESSPWQVSQIGQSLRSQIPGDQRFFDRAVDDQLVLVQIVVAVGVKDGDHILAIIPPIQPGGLEGAQRHGPRRIVVDPKPGDDQIVRR